MLNVMLETFCDFAWNNIPEIGIDNRFLVLRFLKFVEIRGFKELVEFAEFGKIDIKQHC